MGKPASLILGPYLREEEVALDNVKRFSKIFMDTTEDMNGVQQ